MIWFEGVWLVPKACRKKAKTTISRVKDVMSVRIAGARDRIVKRKIIWSKTETLLGLALFPISICTEGKVKSAAIAPFLRRKQTMEKMTIAKRIAFSFLFVDLESFLLAI